MICKFKVKYYEGGLIAQPHQIDGYVAGENSTDCFDKLQALYATDDYDVIDSIEVSFPDWIDDESNIIEIDPTQLVV